MFAVHGGNNLIESAKRNWRGVKIAWSSLKAKVETALDNMREKIANW